MRVGALTRVVGVVAVIALAVMVGAPAPSGSPEAAEPDAPLSPAAIAQATSDDSSRFSLVHGCYALRSLATGQYVVKAPDGSYAATAGSAAAGEPFRMQATELGRYLLYGRARDFLSAPQGVLGDRAVRSEARPSEAADWRIEGPDRDAFLMTLPAAGKVLSASGAGGALVLADRGPAGDAALFSFEAAQGCPDFPEVEVNATGTPTQGPTPFGETRGLIDAHMHMMAFQFLGGRAHCGRPWHRYGVEVALVDCPDHGPNGAGAVLENALADGSRPTHDPGGWPTFTGWPDDHSLTHEGSYYKWLERAWRGGLRTYVNLLVENRVLCEAYPLKQNSCDEMDSVRLQARNIRELEDYIDAQSGGPGKGWFRIVEDPFQARRVINEGKLAVVLGVEVSEPFGCRIYNGQPQCKRADIDRELDELHALGVRQMELVNKFDNALAGVAGDAGTTGVAVNNANRLSTGRYWDMQACDGPPDETDRGQIGLYEHDHDNIQTNVIELLPIAGQAPVYPTGANCNALGLSSLGEHLIRRMIEKDMIVDPDHLSVLARKQVMSLLEAARHSGVVSSHTWSTPDVIPRIYNLGGVITAYAGDSTSFVEKWRQARKQRNDDFFFGYGYGADMNGFGAQGPPRGADVPNPVEYPFKSFDGAVTLDRQRSGSRVYDINVDGVDHYGLYPDWVEDLRKLAGDQIVEDMARGTEAYLQMWERAQGVSAQSCHPLRWHPRRRGLGTLRIAHDTKQVLYHVGQPATRMNRTWVYCIRGRENRRSRIKTVFTPGGKVGLIATNARRGHRLGRVGARVPVRRLRALGARAYGRGYLSRRVGGGRRLVYRVRGKRVSYVAVVARSVATPRRTRAYLRLAGLR